MNFASIGQDGLFITLVPIELEQKFWQILKALVKSDTLKGSKGS